MNNLMRTELNPGTSPTLNANPINAIVRTETAPTGSNTKRRVVARATTNTAQNTGATTGTVPPRRRVIARSATAISGPGTTSRTPATSTTKRNIVARSPRGDASYMGRNTTNTMPETESTTVSVSSSRCLADYIECMNGYCQRAETAYNRCYCSARLSQIDSTYQPAIDNLINQIIMLQGTNKWTDEEMNAWWMDSVGKYQGTNSWENMDNALKIDWASMESRVRGQQAFATGHEYCVQHLHRCYYMASNMRDAYRSEISRDCDAYEASLQNVQNIAETIIEAYK